MKGYKTLSSRYLKIQKRRTMLTIIGIILSVALISGVQIIYASFMDYEERDARANGNYHGYFMSIDYDKAIKIKDNVNVENATYMREEGLTFLRRDNNNNKSAFTGNEDKEELQKDYTTNFLKFRVKGLEDEGFKRFNIDILEGRLPENNSEIVLRERTAKLMSEVKVGDNIEILLGTLVDESGKEVSENQETSTNRFVPVVEKTYRVVGIVKDNTIYMGTTEFAFTAINGNVDGTYNVFIDVKKPRNTYKIAREIGRNLGLPEAEDYRFIGNNQLLRFYGSGPNADENLTLILLIALITGIIIVSTVAVINNSFNISIIEKSAEYGMLRAIGASPGQIRSLVLREATLMSLVGIPLGILAGFAGIKLLFSLFGMLNYRILNDLDLRIVLKPSIFAVSILVSAITVYISAAIPAKRATKVAPIEALKRVDRNIKIKKSKRPKLMGFFFGPEGEIAYKNLSRNRKKFIITVFSLALSVTIYIAFDSLVNQAFYVTKAKLDKYSYQVIAKDEATSQRVHNELESMDNVTKVISSSDTFVAVAVPETKLIKEKIWWQIGQLSDNYMEFYNSRIMTMDEGYIAGLKDQLLQGSIDITELDKGGVIVLQKNVDSHNKKMEYTDYTTYKPSDTIEFAEPDLFEKSKSENFKNTDLKKAKIIGIINALTMFEDYPREGIFMVTTNKGLEKLKLKPGMYKTYVTKELEADGSNIVKYLSDLRETEDLSYFDNVEARAEEDRQVMVTMSILIYGFIALIILISSVNIFNTISSNLYLRKKELGVIKSVGMSQGALRKMIYLEGFYYGLFSIIYGGIAGTGLSFLFYKIFDISQNVKWNVNVRSLAAASLGVIVITSLSTYLPLRKLNTTSIIESIRAEE